MSRGAGSAKCSTKERPRFQHIQIVDTHADGRMLLLDGIVQTTERDEFIYHEIGRSSSRPPTQRTGNLCSRC